MTSSTRAYTIFAMFALVNCIMADDTCVIRHVDNWEAAGLEGKYNEFEPHCIDNGRDINKDIVLRHPGFACIHEAKIYGVVSYRIKDGGEVYLQLVCVHNQKLKQGIGRKLMSSFVTKMRNKGMTSAYGWVDQNNDGSQKLLKSSGFKEKFLDESAGYFQ